MGSGFATGVIGCAVANANASWRSFLICGLIGMAPAVGALNMTLQRDLGIQAPPVTKGGA